MNNEFYKVDSQTAIEETALIRVYPSAAVILSVLRTLIVEGKNSYGAISIPNSELAKACGYSTSTISIGVGVLRDSGFIGIAKIGRNNCYILNPDCVGMTKGKQSTHTILDRVKIVLTSDEAISFKNEITKLKNTKRYKQIKSSSRLNSIEIDAGHNIKANEKQFVDSKTGEIL